LGHGGQARIAELLGGRQSLAVPGGRDADTDAAWLASLNLETLSDQATWAARTAPARVSARLSRARPEHAHWPRCVARAIGDIGWRSAVRAEYRYFWDTWNIRAHTAELGISRHVGDRWLLDGYFRYYSQRHALFYSDNFTERIGPTCRASPAQHVHGHGNRAEGFIHGRSRSRR